MSGDKPADYDELASMCAHKLGILITEGLKDMQDTKVDPVEVRRLRCMMDLRDDEERADVLACRKVTLPYTAGDEVRHQQDRLCLAVLAGDKGDVVQEAAELMWLLRRVQW